MGDRIGDGGEIVEQNDPIGVEPLGEPIGVDTPGEIGHLSHPTVHRSGDPHSHAFGFEIRKLIPRLGDKSIDDGLQGFVISGRVDAAEAMGGKISRIYQRQARVRSADIAGQYRIHRFRLSLSMRPSAGYWPVVPTTHERFRKSSTVGIAPQIRYPAGLQRNSSGTQYWIQSATDCADLTTFRGG